MLHDLVDAVWRETLSISADRLRRELASSWAGLADLPIDSLAVGSKTHAILTGRTEPPHNTTALLRNTEEAVGSRLHEFPTLGHLFGPLTRRLLYLCEHSPTDGLLDCRLLCYPRAMTSAE